MPAEQNQALVVIDRVTGEILDPKDAETVRLARFITNLGQLRKELAEAESIVSDELVERLDRDACWTTRVADGENAWEIKAPSPTAGTTIYPEDILETELETLVREALISPDAAAKALHRRIILELGVPWDADPREIARQVKEALSIEVAGVQVNVERSEARITPIASGINALRKVPGTTTALDNAKREQPAGQRRVTVKLKSQSRDRQDGEEGTR
jgi:hypothetical protein